MPNPYYENTKVDGEVMDSAVLEAIEDGFDGVEVDMTAVEGDVATSQGDITTLQSDVSTLQSDLTAETAASMKKADNLSDVADAATSRTNLGLGTAAVENVGVTIGDVVQLEDVGGGAALPAVDASQLTNVPGIADADLQDLNNGMAVSYFFASF